MEGIERIEDFEYDDYENNDEEEKEGERKNPATHVFGLVDQNPEEDSDDENTESIQAQSYDRSFVINGPQVKVYKKADEGDNQRGLILDSNLPILFNEDGHKIRPQNAILLQNEGKLIFNDSNDAS